jgi:hypothetical protein
MKTACNMLRSFAFLLVLAMLPGVGPAAAETLRLTYVGLLGPMKLLTADLDVALAPEGGGVGAFHTVAAIATEPTGAGALFPFRMTLETNGGRRENRFGPIWHRSSSVAWQKEQRVDLDYAADGSVTTVVNPPTRETRIALEAGLAAGTIDPMTAGMALINQVMRAGQCTGTSPVFDGIRRYDLTAVGSETAVPPTRISGSAGPQFGSVVACRLAIDYLSGFPANASQSGFYPREITIWLAPLAGGLQIVPVMASVDLAIGQLRIELISASATGN